MSKVAVVTDSTAGIPNDRLKGLPVKIAPLQVIWDNQTFLDNVDITPAQFYERLKNSPTMPTTSQTTPAAFESIYQSLLDEGYDVLSIHISGKLSGTMDSAIQAKAALKTNRIEIVDSETTGMSLGFAALNIAKAAVQGASLAECKALAEQSRNHVGVYFLVSTLEFLHRGGRIGGAAAFLGTVLNLKPILTVSGGRIEAVERVRTMNKAIDRLLDLVEAEVTKRHTPIRLSALHANSPKEAEELLGRARQRFGVSEVEDAVVADVSPVLGTHTGPGALGFAYMAGL